MHEAPPTRNIMLKWAVNFQNPVTTGDCRRSGGPRISAQKVNEVRKLFEEHPRTSFRTTKKDLSVPRSSVCRILCEKKKMFPHRTTNRRGGENNI